MNYRNPALIELARNAPCQWCGNDDGTTVWAHSNSSTHGKGMGIKAHDCFGAVLCMRCHDIVDGRNTEGYDRETRVHIFEQARNRTLLHLWQSGLIRVA